MTSGALAELVFVKLGGSLITDKTLPEAPRTSVIGRLARELAEALQALPDLRLVLGHGSGSFGHVVGERFGVRSGVTDEKGWRGFALTSAAAQRLNRLVSDAMLSEGVLTWSLQPSASARCRDGRLLYLDSHPVIRALEEGLVPLVYGDVALDESRGGTIISTEEIFAWLARRLKPNRIILVGEAHGVRRAADSRSAIADVIPEITPHTLPQVLKVLGQSHGVDVTGGMLSKVRSMCSLVEDLPGLEVRVMSGAAPGQLVRVLVDPFCQDGTVIRAQPSAAANENM